MFAVLIYCLGHIAQFFLWCIFGTELAHHSSSLAHYVYNCGWEDIDDNQFRKSLMLVILRAQRPKRLSVKNLTYLDLATFLGVCLLNVEVEEAGIVGLSAYR